MQRRDARLTLGLPCMFADSGAGGWFFKSAGAPHGPLSVERVRVLLEAGVIRLSQAVWRDEGTRKIFRRVESVLEGDGRDALPQSAEGVTSCWKLSRRDRWQIS